MIREHRYLVLKLKDVRAALTGDERGLLNHLARKINDYRLSEGKKPIECVVVESDWPEFEPTWRAIEKRVDREESEGDEPGRPDTVLIPVRD